MAEAPSIEELGPLLGSSAALDEPAPSDDMASSGAFEAAAVMAVGTREKATALKDAISEVLREHGLIGGETSDTGDEEGGSEEMTDPDESAEYEF